VGAIRRGKNDLFGNEILAPIAAEHNKAIGRVVLRWLIQRGVVAIPKSVHKARIVENFSIWDFELTQAEMDSIATLDTGCSLFFSHQDPAMVRALSTRKLDI